MGKGDQERSSPGHGGDKIEGYQLVATLDSRSPKQSPGGCGSYPLVNQEGGPPGWNTDQVGELP